MAYRITVGRYKRPGAAPRAHGKSNTPTVNQDKGRVVRPGQAWRVARR